MQPVLIAATDQPVGGLAGFAATLMDTLGQALGGAGAAVANGLDSILPFLPSEVILPLAGLSASQGHMSLLAAIVWTTVGSMAGSTVMYYLGAWLGRDRARAILLKLPLVKAHEVDRTEAWFRRHGGKAVLIGRVVPVFRSLISIPAGVERMSYPLFLLYTTVGSLIWNSCLVVAGYQLGENWQQVDRYAGLAKKVVIAVVVVAVLYYVASRLFFNRGRRRDAADAHLATQVLQHRDDPPTQPR